MGRPQQTVMTAKRTFRVGWGDLLGRDSYWHFISVTVRSKSTGDRCSFECNGFESVKYHRKWNSLVGENSPNLWTAQFSNRPTDRYWVWKHFSCVSLDIHTNTPLKTIPLLNNNISTITPTCSLGHLLGVTITTATSTWLMYWWIKRRLVWVNL